MGYGLQSHLRSATSWGIEKGDFIQSFLIQINSLLTSFPLRILN